MSSGYHSFFRPFFRLAALTLCLTLMGAGPALAASPYTKGGGSSTYDGYTGAGNGGMGGGGGNMLWGDSFDPKDNDGGIGGNGGKVFIIETTATQNQAYTYACGAAGTGGAGGAKGQDGTKGTDGGATTFGVFTSANGKIYTSGLMDIQSGAVYAQKGADYAGTITGLEGSGGAGGKQGRNGKYAQRKDKETGMYHTYVAARATEGTAGENGKPGCVIVEW